MLTSYQPAGQPDAGPRRLGRYELLGKLAAGGMGEIHLARLAGDGGFEKLVVVKRLLPELVASEQFVAMFLDEARVAARLSHPNVCEVYELGRDGNDYYIAMQYLEGVSFGALIARAREADRARELRLVSGLLLQACEGLHHAHEARGADGEPLGLVHRDVSPSNLFVTTAGVVKVLDFGIAKARGATARTEVGFVKGTYAYMSPEQVKGDELDRRSDVFALGTVLFELCTHQRLFKRSSDYLAAKAILEEPIPSASSVDPSIPAPLSAVIDRALARSPADRFATARALGDAVAAVIAPMTPGEIAARIAEDLRPELSQQRTRQQRVLADHAGADDVPTRRVRGPDAATGPTVARAPRSEAAELRRRQRWWPAAAAALVVAAAAGMLAMQRCGDAPVDTARATAAADDTSRTTTAAGDTSRTTTTAGDTSRTTTVAATSADSLSTAASPSTADSPPTAGSPTAASPPTGVSPSTAASPRTDDSPPTGDSPSTTASVATREPARQPGPAPRKSPRDRNAAPVDATSRTASPNSAAKPPKSATGFLSIDSTPFATITLDGTALGETPLIRMRVPAGRHTVRATLRDGRTKTVTVDIPDGKLGRPINLRW